MKETARQQAVTKKPPPARKNRSRKKTGVAAPKKQNTAERRRFEQLFYRLSTFFQATDSSQLDAKIEKGLSDVAGYFRTDRATLWEFSLDGQELIPTHSYLLQGVEAPVPIRSQTNSLQPEAFKKSDNPTASAYTNQPTIAALDALPLRKADDKSFLAIPLLVAGSMRGISTLSHVRSKYQWHDQKIVQAQRIGEIFAYVLDRKRSQQFLEQRIRFETLVSNISAQFATGSLYAIDKEIEYALEQLRVFFEVDRCTIGRFSDDGSKLILEYSMQSEEVKLAPAIVLEDELPWYFKQLKQGKPVIINKLTDFPAEAAHARQFCDDRGVKSFLSFPLMSGSKTLGAFVLMSTRGEKQWPEELVERFHVITTLFTNVLVRLYTDKVIRASEEFNRSILASLHYHIAILDKSGLILAVNEAWERFGRDNGGMSSTNIGPGANYLDACRIADAKDDPFAQAAIIGIQKVQDGAQEMFSLEYPCHAPNEERWFMMRILPLKSHDGGVVISHTDISELKKAEKELRQLKDQMEAENIYLWKEIKQEHGFEEIVGESDAIKYMLYRIKQVAPTDATILIQGETGTGKGLVARALHKLSDRKQRPLVNINCAALPANLIESELFGREKGAFTGAQARQIGRFELADRGTIFLDEIGELPIDLQAKLLRVIEDGEFERLGSPHSIKVNARIIASTNRNLEEEIKNGRFRKDLYYRLHVFPITTPPLRQRKEDIPLLVEHFVQKYSKIMGKEISTISKSSIKRLHDYPWPGNVRELGNIIERAVITSTGKTLKLSELHSSQKSGEYPQDPSHKKLADVERAHILKTLKQAGWRIEGVSGAASILGLNPSTLRSRMKKMGIQRQSYD